MVKISLAYVAIPLAKIPPEIEAAVSTTVRCLDDNGNRLLFFLFQKK